MVEICNRLKEYRERTKTKMPAISRATGISKESLYKWEKGTKPSDLDTYFKLKAYLDEMEMKEEANKMEVEAQRTLTLLLPLIVSQPTVQSAEGRTATGTVVLFNEEPHIVVERINAPFLGTVEGAIEVTGDSMAQAVKDGSRIAIRRLNDIRLLDWGSCYYIINKNMKGIVRRVYPVKEGIRMLSDHPDQSAFPPIERTWEQIISILEIVGVINKL